MSLIYDDRGHLIYAQVYRHKYYIATDECGTPVMVFNQYGEGIREIMRSPYGHIVYDSNPYLYLPVDFCGGLLDQVCRHQLICRMFNNISYLNHSLPRSFYFQFQGDFPRAHAKRSGIRSVNWTMDDSELGDDSVENIVPESPSFVQV